MFGCAGIIKANKIRQIKTSCLFKGKQCHVDFAVVGVGTQMTCNVTFMLCCKIKHFNNLLTLFSMKTACFILAVSEDTYERTLTVDGEEATLVVMDTWETERQVTPPRPAGCLR